MIYRFFRATAPLLAALLLLSGCSLGRQSQATFGEPLPTPTIPDTVSVTVDAGQAFQTIDGLGVNVNGTYWGDGKLAPALDALRDDLGATVYRVIIETPYWEAVNDDADPSHFNWDAYDTIYARPEFQSLFAILRHLGQQPDAKVVLNVMGAMPPWMGDGVIDAGAEAEWVEMTSSLLVYARDREGLDVHLIAPLNEIDVGPPEGPQVDPAQYARLMHLLAQRLDALDLGAVRFVVPDITFSSNAKKYLPPLLADDLVMSKLAAFALHSYDGTVADIRGQLASSPYPNQSFWMTEYSQWCVACQSPDAHDEAWYLGADTVSFLLQYLDRGANGALLYDGVDGYYIHHGTFQSWGVLAYNPDTGEFSPRTRFIASAQIFRFVRPGMQRVAVSSSADQLLLLAFRDPTSGALSIVGRNPTAHPVTIAGALGGVQPAPALTLYQTAAGAAMSPAALQMGADGFSAQVAPDSVFAISSLQP